MNWLDPVLVKAWLDAPFYVEGGRGVIGEAYHESEKWLAAYDALIPFVQALAEFRPLGGMYLDEINDVACLIMERLK